MFLLYLSFFYRNYACSFAGGSRKTSHPFGYILASYPHCSLQGTICLLINVVVLPLQ